jgi:hypothetical protein
LYQRLPSSFARPAVQPIFAVFALHKTLKNPAQVRLPSAKVSWRSPAMFVWFHGGTKLTRFYPIAVGDRSALCQTLTAL